MTTSQTSKEPEGSTLAEAITSAKAWQQERSCFIEEGRPLVAEVADFREHLELVESWYKAREAGIRLCTALQPIVRDILFFSN